MLFVHLFVNHVGRTTETSQKGQTTGKEIEQSEFVRITPYSIMFNSFLRLNLYTYCFIFPCNILYACRAAMVFYTSQIEVIVKQ